MSNANEFVFHDSKGGMCVMTLCLSQFSPIAKGRHQEFVRVILDMVSASACIMMTLIHMQQSIIMAGSFNRAWVAVGYIELINANIHSILELRLMACALTPLS